MARRSFRWCPERREMVEITNSDDARHHFVRPDTILDPVRSPIDGTLLDSRSRIEDHCAKHGVIPTEELKGVTKVADRYETARQERAMRELLWQKVDAAMHSRRR